MIFFLVNLSSCKANYEIRMYILKSLFYYNTGAKFAFDIYDFEGKARMDMFYLGDCLRGLNLNPTLKMIDKLGGAKKKGEKFIKLEEVSQNERNLRRKKII